MSYFSPDVVYCTQVSVLIRSHFFTGIVFKFRIRAPATLAKKSNLHLERPTSPRTNCLRFPANGYHAHVYGA